MTTKVTYTPLHADEITLKGETFEHTIQFSALDDGGTAKTAAEDVCIYVPAAVKRADDKQVGLEHRVLVFWTANSAVKDNTLNDTLTHGLRASAEATGTVLISLPSPGDHASVPFTEPDFHVLRDQDIVDCFKAVKLKGKPGRIHLASHSRGHRGLTRTLMGNDNIGVTNAKERDPATATIKTSFIDIKKIDRVIYLDNFFGSAQRILAHLVPKGLSNRALRVYHFTDGINITEKTIVGDMAGQFIDLAKSMSMTQGAAIGCLRFIGETTSVIATLDNKNVTLATKIFKDAELLTILFTKRLPIRSTFSTVKPLPANKMEIGAFSKSMSFSVKEKDALLNFLNQEKILRISFKFDTKIAAHHFFPCEYAHEFYA